MKASASYLRAPFSTASARNSDTTLHFPTTAVTLKTHPPPITQLFSSKPPQNRRLCTCDRNGYHHSLSYSPSDSDEYGAETEFPLDDDDDDVGIVIDITKIGKRSRRIESRIAINGDLQTVWGILTDYERLSDFIPGLAVSRLLEKRDSYARLFQIGQQNLALGLKFNAKAVLDCYEKDLENLSSGRRRDIEFKMVEGDFEIFEGKWSIEEFNAERLEARQTGDLLEGQEFQTVLSYVLKVKPKLWLPVRLVEGKLCREIKTNLSCVRKEAHLRLASSSS